jgi:hypothetical protein
MPEPPLAFRCGPSREKPDHLVKLIPEGGP